MRFKRTTHAVQRCKHEQQRCSYDREDGSDARRYQSTLPKSVKPNLPQDEFKAVLKRVQGMEGELAEELRGFSGTDPDEEAGAVEAALKDVQAAERLVLAAEGLAASPQKSGRPFAARHLPQRPTGTPPKSAPSPRNCSPEQAWVLEVSQGPAPAPEDYGADPEYPVSGADEFDLPDFDGIAV